ncbi:hypothetical protein FPQ18DRAFT_307759 [Pyronema domesticum]|nr:hypothetical protein FPQ18DRAFT_307759 [Pyronema domesticum]
MDSDNEDIIRGVSRVEGGDEIEVRPNGKGTAVAVADDSADTEEQVEEAQEEKQEEESDDDEDDEEGGEEEYIVEEILGHRWDGDKVMYHVKWENYPARKDWTWEPEEHLTTGAKEILESYHDSLPNGKPEKPAAKKRGRQSLVQAALASAKKPRTGVTATPAKNKKAGTEKSDAKWKPPASGWEENIAAIDTIERNETGLIAFVQWANGKKSQHPIETMYQNCPQKMLKFYEQHLTFKDTSTSS